MGLGYGSDILTHARRLTELLEAGRPCVAVTLAAVRGHAPQELGAKMLVTAEGLEQGTVGGGKVEAKAIVLAQGMLGPTSPSVQSFTWNLQRDVGMTCGGEVTFLFERHDVRAWEIAVFGAGHVAQALVPLLLTLDCRVTCVDAREDWLARLPDSPRLRRVRSDDMAGEALQLDAAAFVMLMTQGHAHDVPILRALLADREPPYVGVIGSEVKAIKIRQELRDAGIEASRIERLHCPMGLPIGNRQPAEIAISMTAQVLRERDRLSPVVD